MKRTRTLILLGFALLAVPMGCRHSTSAPEPGLEAGREIDWNTTGFDNAMDLAEQDGRFVLVYAMAQWCGWCRQMSQHTWADSRVIEWVNLNTVPFQWDIDDVELRGLWPRISGVPTVVLIRSGTEIDRKIGYSPPDEYLKWFGSHSACSSSAPISSDAASPPAIRWAGPAGFSPGWRAR